MLQKIKGILLVVVILMILCSIISIFNIFLRNTDDTNSYELYSSSVVHKIIIIKASPYIKILFILFTVQLIIKDL